MGFQRRSKKLIILCVPLLWLWTVCRVAWNHDRESDGVLESSTEVFTTQAIQNEKLINTARQQHQQQEVLYVQNEIDEGVNKELDQFMNAMKTGSSRITQPTKNEALQVQRQLLSDERKETNIYDTWKAPVRNIIFTSWRSGSTFLGEMITRHPAMFYHYEPLLHFGIVQVRSGALAEEGLRVMRSLLNCNYTDLVDYINYGIDHENLHSHNVRLWRHCRRNPSLCQNPEFLSQICQMFPFQVMKTVRMRLLLAQKLLEEDKDLRILLLLRDPRGTLLSRKRRDWCPESPDCFDPSHLCQDMVDDYDALLSLREQFPGKVLALRYEDISTNPILGAKRVLSFFRLEYHSKIDRFLQTHTVLSLGGVSSTYRNSKTTPFAWIKHFSRKEHQWELQEIEEKCGDAMRLWGYNQLLIELQAEGSEPLAFEKAVLGPPPFEDMLIGGDEQIGILPQGNQDLLDLHSWNVKAKTGN